MPANLPDPSATPWVRTSPNLGVASYQAGQVGQATEKLGGGVGSLSNAANMRMIWEHQAADVQSGDALTRLKQAHLGLLNGENGFERLMNGDATRKGVVGEYNDKYKLARESVGGGLSELAKQTFDKKADNDYLNFQASTLRHAMGQDIANRSKTLQDQISVSAQMQANHTANGREDRVALERGDLMSTTEVFIKTNGLDGARAEVTRQTARGAGHEAVARQYIAMDQAGKAAQYVNALGPDELTSAQRIEIEALVKPQAEYEVARGIASPLLADFKKGIPMDQLYDRLQTETTGKGKQVHDTALQHLQQGVAMVTSGRNQVEGAVVLGHHLKPGARDTGYRDPRLLEIQKTDPQGALQVRNAIHAYDQSRNAIPDGVNNSLPAFTRYQGLQDHLYAGTLTQEMVGQSISVIGGGKANALMQALRNQDIAGSAKIDPDIVKNAMPDSARGNKNYETAFKAIVDTRLMEHHRVNGKKAMSPEEQARILRSASEDYTVLKGGWFGDATKPQFKLKPEELAKSYPGWMDARYKGYTGAALLSLHKRVLETRAKFKRGENYTDEQIADSLAKRDQAATNVDRIPR